MDLSARQTPESRMRVIMPETDRHSDFNSDTSSDVYRIVPADGRPADGSQFQQSF